MPVHRTAPLTHCYTPPMARPHESVRRLEARQRSLGPAALRVVVTRGWPLLVVLFLFGAAPTCRGSSSRATACAGGSTAIYQTHARSTTATVYCPTFLPAGFEMVSAQPPDLIQPPNVAPYSDVEFRNGEQTIEIIQGNLPIIPRNDAGLPISTPERDVTFGDIPAQLFIEYQRVPLVVFTRSDTAPTRAVQGSPGMDPAVVVRVAEGMRKVKVP